jgi:hypothetical protein
MMLHDLWIQGCTASHTVVPFLRSVAVVVVVVVVAAVMREYTNEGIV